MAYKISNFARMSLIQSAALADTTLFVSAEDGDLLPALGVGDTAPAVLFDATEKEIVYITAEADGALTVTRAQEATAARDWPSGTKLIHTPTAALFQLVLNAAFAAGTFIGTATYAGNTYTVDVGAGNPIPSLGDGERVSFLVSDTNTVAGPNLIVTNGVDSTATRAINSGSGVVQIGDMAAGFLVEARYSTATGTWLLTTESSHQEYATSLNTGPVPAVNRHPNGRLDAWSNGTTFSTPASLSETADGWLVRYDGTIGTFTVNRQTFAPGQTDIPDNPRWFIRWDQSGAGSGSTFRQFRVRVPGVAWRSGETVTRVLWMKADAARNVGVGLTQHFGTGGAPSADVEFINTNFPVTTDWQQVVLSTTLPSVSGKTIGSNLDDALYLVLSLPINTTMTIDVAMDDIRPGGLTGKQSDTFPVPTWLGGTGGSFDDLDEFVDALTGVVHIAGTETITGAKTFSADLALSSAAPRLLVSETDQAANEKLWDLASVGGDLVLRSRTDLDGAGITALTIDRGTGTAVTSVTFGTTVIVPDGAAATPSVRVSSEQTGLYRASATELGFSAAGVSIGTWSSTAILTSSRWRGGSGLVGSPGVSFNLDNDSGFFPVASNNIAGVAGGTQCWDFTTVRFQMAAGVDLVLPTTAHAPTSVFSAGYRGAPVVSGNSTYAFPLAEAGHAVYHDEAGTRTWTIPANASVAHSIGTVFILDNTGNSGAAGAITLAITTDTLRRGDGVAGTGSRTIPASAVAAIRKVAAQIWIITGTFT